MAIRGIPLGEWSGSNATRELHQTIKDFVESNNQSTKWMLRLTWAIAGLTLVMLIAVIVQIVFAMH